jgi:quinol monooxygenase YgiN
VIIRVFRMRAKPGRDAELERHLREHAIPLIRHSRGLLSFWTGQTGADFLTVTVWRDAVALSAFEQDPAVAAEDEPLVAESSVEHFHLIDGAPRP